MANLLFGITTSVICGVLLYLCYRSYRQGRTGRAVLCIVLCALLLRVFSGLDPYLHPWDERYHALVAKNLINHPCRPTLYDDPVLPYDFRDWQANHVWVHKQPLPLWGMALGMKLFGVSEFAMRVPSILLSTLAVFFTCMIGSLLFSPGVGLIAGYFHAVHGLIIRITTGRKATDHTDLFHLAFVELAVLLAVIHGRTGRRFIVPLIGLAVGLAVLCKWLTALVVIPVWIMLRWGKDRTRELLVNLSLMMAACVATFLPWQIYIRSAFPREAQWESSFNWRHIIEDLAGHPGGVFFHFSELVNYGELVYLPILWFLWAVWKQRESRQFAVALWFVLPFAFFTMVRTRMPAYTLFAAPSVFLMSAAFMADIAAREFPPRLRLVRNAVMALLVLLPLVHLVPDIKLLSRTDRTRPWAEDLKEFSSRTDTSRAVIFNAPRPVETMFYTNGSAYGTLPAKDEVAELTKKGYRIFVVDTEAVSEDLRESGEVTLIRIRP